MLPTKFQEKVDNPGPSALIYFFKPILQHKLALIIAIITIIILIIPVIIITIIIL